VTPTGIVAASKVYQKLKKLVPQSNETIQAPRTHQGSRNQYP